MESAVPPFRLQPPVVAPRVPVWVFSPGLTARGVCLAPASTGSWRLGLRLELAGSPQRPAESSLPNGYGLAVLLLLLSTSPRGDAVTIGYKVQTEPWRGLTPLRLITLTGARVPASPGPGPRRAGVLLPELGRAHRTKKSAKAVQRPSPICLLESSVVEPCPILGLVQRLVTTAG